MWILIPLGGINEELRRRNQTQSLSSENEIQIRLQIELQKKCANQDRPFYITESTKQKT